VFGIDVCVLVTIGVGERKSRLSLRSYILFRSHARANSGTRLPRKSSQVHAGRAYLKHAHTRKFLCYVTVKGTATRTATCTATYTFLNDELCGSTPVYAVQAGYTNHLHGPCTPRKILVKSLRASITLPESGIISMAARLTCDADLKSGEGEYHDDTSSIDCRRMHDPQSI